ncbi:MAG TPA: transcriptional repressor LexA [Candidatus Omnitrophota bacterium]|nr:transcriptional repressor LexA [Candidatus Omnitrophota bacterium]HQL42256.1 transcriptional repressor LexA [Candidatus Omnitrophota bacterium]
MIKELTEKQKNVLQFIFNKIKNDKLPPTIREIAEEFGFSSTGTVRDYLRALVDKGYIKINEGKARAIELVKDAFRIPVLGAVAAGSPTLAVEDIEGYVDLNDLFFSDADIFALRVKGDSMIEAGIMPDDLVLVRRQQAAEIGDVVVALIGDEATVKHLVREGKNFYLHPANSAYQPIPVNEDVSLIGKVITSIRRYS